MTIFYRSYLITFGLLLGAGASLVLYLDHNGSISLHWVLTGLAMVAVAGGLVLFATGAFGEPVTVERWADNASCHAEGTAYVALLTLPVYGLLWLFSRGGDKPPVSLPITEMRNKRKRRQARRRH